ncbi:sugar porter family MFS transporter [Acetobacter estunensis]|uniref:sugar porter family MFS transporter n=1 Tax=Acetobacter estunensis TaxID=104097 RepID=UPI001C2D2678|nr:sugar porter family MFS transporter [Acetobacter estunensis]MBV1837846.1 sugar porter family MFS transporter [Acetobacter estunensis]
MSSSTSGLTSHQMAARARRLSIFVGAAAALAGLMFGLDTGVIAGALPLLSHDLGTSDRTAEWIVSSLMLAAAFGSFQAGTLAERWGRRGTLLIASVLFLIGIALCALAPGVEVMIAGRICLGLGVGLAAFAAPLYIAEITAQSRRGRMIALYQLMITIGILMAFISDGLLAQGGHWRWMFGVIALPTLMFLGTTLMIPPSPRWLLMKGRREEAVQVLRELRGSSEAAKTEADGIELQLSHEKQAGLALLRVSPGFRRTFTLGIAIQALQQFSGINVLMYYAPTVLERLHFSASAAVWCTTALGVANTLATIVSVMLIDRWGRRGLLLLSTAGAAFAMLAFGTLLWTGDHSPALTVGLLVLFICAFAVGEGPLPWVLCSEIQPLRGRTFAISCSTLSNWIANWAVSNVLLSCLNLIGAHGVFWCLGAFNALFFAVTWFFVPETRGESLEDIEERVNAGVPLRRLGRT